MKPEDGQNHKLSKEDLMNAMLSIKQLQSYEVPRRSRLLGNWLRQGDFGIIFAYRGVGKTWFACLIARSLAEMQNVGPWASHAQVKVVYVDGEMPAEDMQFRTDIIGASESDRFILINHEILFQQSNKDLNLANREHQNIMTNICIEKGVDILILDNLSSLFTNLAEDRADDWDKFVKPWLLELRRRKITVILLCHAGKDLKLRGTSKKEDSVFWTIELSDSKDSPMIGKQACRFISRFTKSRNAPEMNGQEYQWTITTHGKSVTIDCEPHGTDIMIFNLIRQGYHSCSEIAEALNLTKGRISQIVTTDLVPKGFVKISGRHYEPTGKTPLSDVFAKRSEV